MSKSRFTTILLSLMIAAPLLLLLSSVALGRFDSSLLILDIVAVLVITALLFAHIRGWRWSAEALVITITVLSIVAANPAYVANHYYLPVFVPCVIAAALLAPWWSIGVYFATLIGSIVVVGLRAGSFEPELFGQLLEFDTFIISLVIASCIAVASGITQSAQRAAERHALQVAAARDRAEQQSLALATVNAQMVDQLAQQHQLLELVIMLEVPTVQLADGVIFAPIVGHVDSRRAHAITTRLLKEVHQSRTTLVVLDISGVSVMDTAVAQALLNTARALKLLGCSVAMSGISTTIALTLTDLGIGLDDVITVRSPQEALAALALPARQQSNGGPLLASN